MGWGKHHWTHTAQGERLVLVRPAQLLLLIGKVEIINAREVAPALATSNMFNSSEQSQEGEGQGRCGMGSLSVALSGVRDGSGPPLLSLPSPITAP